MGRGCLVCVICNSNCIHSFIFKICIVIVNTLKMCTYSFMYILQIFFRAPIGALLFLACLSVFPSVCLSVRCCGHSNLVIYNRIPSKFHIWIASIKLWFKVRYGIFPTNDYQDGRQIGRHLSVDIYSLLWSL